MKTVRFTSVVEQAGRPEPYLSWTPPEKDSELKKLVKQERVMTVHQELRGPRKDFGTVGLHRERAGQILIFPKSLRRFADQKVVGVNYNLVAPENHNAGPKVKLPRRAPRPAKPAPSPARQVPQAVTPRPEPSRDELLHEIRRAVAELKRGNAVAAYDRLRELI